MSKHTPGPWHIKKQSPRYTNLKQIVGKDDQHVCNVFTQLGHDNANLIASAPELLEALKSASNQLTSDGHCPTLVAILDRVIAKATGGEE